MQLSYEQTLTKQHCDKQSKKFYFQEINKIIVFPPEGNRGKYDNYLVQIKIPRTIKQEGIVTLLGEFLYSPEVDSNYPHTVGYFKEYIDEGDNLKFEYLELRKICIIEEFWMFLNSSNI
jgi:hypothetical protein